MCAKTFMRLTPTDLKYLTCSWWPRLLVSGVLAGTLSLAGHAQTPPSAPEHKSNRGVLYAATGAELTQYDVDAEAASLAKRSSIRLPANVQYAWPHPSRT